MCGIVGYVGKGKNCVRVLIDGLKNLEYRGYDSSGIAYIKYDDVHIVKESGKIEKLEKLVCVDDESSLGIGHTRWATHGRADEKNAHPHKVGKFTIVHNGIIENYQLLKQKLMGFGYIFKSDTDTEVICALLDFLYKQNHSILESVRNLQHYLVGSYALGIICDDDKEHLYAIKYKSPLIIGVNDDENYIASDVPAILGRTNKYIILEDGDYACLSYYSINVYHDFMKKDVLVRTFDYDVSSIDKNGYDHFMLKEIHEQPDVFKRSTNYYINNGLVSLIDKMPNFEKYEKIRIVACGSAMHAGLIGKQMIEKYANLVVQVDIASEFRYNKQFLGNNELVIVISQSGETADTLEALKIAKEHGNDTLGIINEKGSSIARESKMVLYTEAGKEIAVATTKAYSAQVAMLALIALNISCSRNIKNRKEIINILKDFKIIPNLMEELLQNNECYRKIADYLVNYNDVFFIGRGIDYALAQEGSLKLKEISYTHSEAYAAGELKHGTISLIDEGTPVIAVVTDDNLALKTINNIKEVKSRGAFVVCVTDKDLSGDTSFYDEIIVVPKINDLLSPLLTIIPLQMIAYELAKLKGCNIDKPKNLAKSVTVE